MKKMPTVIRAEIMGFCSGVQRAVEMAEQLADRHPGKKTYSLGHLVHNRQVIRKLETLGIQPIDSVSHVEPGIVVIRAHGETPDVFEELERRGFEVVDATCPKVKRSHRIISDYSKQGYHIIIAGESDHSEVKGLVGRATAVTVLESVADAESFRGELPAILLAQTTFSPTDYERICGILSERYPELQIFRTICPAMEKRHDAVEALAGKVDAILVVGGLQSANTRRLFERSRATGKPSWHIEEASGLPVEITQYCRIGITAGASTPTWIIEEIEGRLKEKTHG